MQSTKARSTKRSALVVAVVLGAVLSGGAALASCFEHAVDDLTGGNSGMVFEDDGSKVPASMREPQLPDGVLSKPELPDGTFLPPKTKKTLTLQEWPAEFSRPSLPPITADDPELPIDPSKAMIPTT